MNLEKVAVVGASGYSGEELVRLLMPASGRGTGRAHFAPARGQTARAVFPNSRGCVTRPSRSSKRAWKPFWPQARAWSFSRCRTAWPRNLRSRWSPRGCGSSISARIFGSRTRRSMRSSTAKRITRRSSQRSASTACRRSTASRSASAQLVASPGCYPTSIIVPLHPLLQRRLLKPASIVINSMSGVSGAGRNAQRSNYLYAECNESVRAYSVPKHRHLAEIEQELSARPTAKRSPSAFTPHLVPVNRGIHTTIHAAPAPTWSRMAHRRNALREAYAARAFRPPARRHRRCRTRRTSRSRISCDIAWRHDPRTGRVVLLSAEDNLVKGAAGQAVQSLNVMCGWPETTALL